MTSTMIAQPVLRPFRASDLDVIVNRDGEQIPKGVMLAQALAGPAFTAMLDKTPIGCAGMIIPWPGLGMTWMVLSEEIGNHGLWMYRTVRVFLDDMVRRHQLHRVEGVALVDTPRNQSWHEGLGFHVEQHGVARKFLADGRSVVRYEWVKED
jgi:hypothetical protein